MKYKGKNCDFQKRNSIIPYQTTRHKTQYRGNQLCAKLCNCELWRCTSVTRPLKSALDLQI